MRILSFSSIILISLFASAFAIQISVVARLEGKADGDWFGAHVANLGDINNDGYEDFGIGSVENGGRVYIYFGSPTFDTVPDLIIVKDSFNNLGTGHTFEGTGDLNKDGYDDFMVTFRNQLLSRYQVKIYLGSAFPDTVADYVISDTFYEFGIFTDAGDLDLNGYKDIAITSFVFPSKGMIGIYLQDSIFNSVANLFYTDGQNDFGGFGMKIADFNGDGYDDLLTSSEKVWPNGSSYIYFGKEALVNTPDLVLPRKGYFAVGDINADNVSDFGISYQLPAFYFGGTLLDTIPDLAIGASAVGKINRDIYGDIVQAGSFFAAFGYVRVYLGGSPMDTFVDWDTLDIACASFRGAVTVDINGDSVDEIICPSPDYPCDAFRGVVYIFSSDTTTDVSSQRASVLPKDFTLNQNFPNPFNSSTVITYTLKATSHVNIKIYNIKGEEVITLVDLSQWPNSYSVAWTGKDEKGQEVASGLYFARLLAGAHSQTIKLTLLR